MVLPIVHKKPYNQAIKYAPVGRRTAYSLREKSTVYERRYTALESFY